MAGDELALAALFDGYRVCLCWIIRLRLDSGSPSRLIPLRCSNFEHLSNNETVQVVGLSKSAASSPYMRALKQLKGILTSIPHLERILGFHPCWGNRGWSSQAQSLWC
jgi:hypothetical protein